MVIKKQRVVDPVAVILIRTGVYGGGKAMIISRSARAIAVLDYMRTVGGYNGSRPKNKEMKKYVSLVF